MSGTKQQSAGKGSSKGSAPGKQELVRRIERRAKTLPTAELQALAAQLGVGPVYALTPGPYGKRFLMTGVGRAANPKGGLKIARQLARRIHVSADLAGAAREQAEEDGSEPGDDVVQGAGLQARLSREDAEARLAERLADDLSTDWIASEVAGAGDVVKRLQIARGTLDNWRKNGWIIALPKGPRNFVYPLRQFHGLRPVEGLKPIAEQFRSPEAAWQWLVIPNRMTYDRPPIDLLHDGEVEPVVSAAEASLDYA